MSCTAGTMHRESKEEDEVVDKENEDEELEEHTDCCGCGLQRHQLILRIQSRLHSHDALPSPAPPAKRLALCGGAGS
ncbi:hypothetical protein NDU88_008691 [Pleurodeles waltl]|uniref:Uncharacterized protein n=1 Tax=Pleurodeles waltl TaxID=8319 RepID=A0AAV7PV23_PLEWA|nr:hypothetical protein NDU88_008691 [Pleurodeles waltl]